MTIEKNVANRILANLEKTADKVESLAKAGKLDPRVASQLVGQLDGFADKFQVAAFGPKSLEVQKAKVAKVLQSDSDEKYMDTFDNPNKPLETDADEPYMHKTEAPFNGKAQPTFDQDRTTTVSERDEYNVRDVSEWADGTKKQPSWSKGPAGKSTKQGSTAPASGKSWAR